MLEHRWSDITQPALQQLRDAQSQKPKLLPVTNDIMKLSTYLKTAGGKHLETLLGKDTEEAIFKDAWIQLAKISLAYLILFNRRRSGEMGRVKISHFENRRHPSNTQLIEGSLSPLELELSKSFKRMEIKGKRGKSVPVLLTPKVDEWLLTLQKHRITVGVPSSNAYLFALPGGSGQGHIRGHDVLRSFSELCGAESPATLRSTQLRKHVATVSQLANLRENELDILAKFLGHDIRVHREYYRLPHDTTQVAKVSKLLMACEGGADITGMNLDDIDVTSAEGQLIASRFHYNVIFFLFQLN